MSINFIKVKDTHTFLAKVSEEINNKYLNDYLKTQIQSQNLTLNNNSKIFSLYNEETKSYLITLVDSLKNDIVLEPYVFYSHYINSNQNNSTDLFLFNSFFALYDNKELIYYKKITNNFEKDDIVNYVNQILKKDINNLYEISFDEYKKYKDKYVTNYKDMPKVEYIKIEDNRSALYYLSYLIIVIFIFIFYYIDINNKKDLENQKHNKIEKIENVKKEYQSLLLKYVNNERITNDLIILFKILKQNEIILKHINISEDSSQIVVNSSSKEVLFDFLDYYDENSIINKIEYIKEDNSYEMVATVKLYK